MRNLAGACGSCGSGRQLISSQISCTGMPGPSGRQTVVAKDRAGHRTLGSGDHGAVLVHLLVAERERAVDGDISNPKKTRRRCPGGSARSRPATGSHRTAP